MLKTNTLSKLAIKRNFLSIKRYHTSNNNSKNNKTTTAKFLLNGERCKAFPLRVRTR